MTVNLAPSRDLTVHRLHDLLRVAILDRGDIIERDRLLDESTLMRRFDVARDVLREALAILAAEGLIVRRRGLGTLVVGSSFTVEGHLPSRTGDLTDQFTAGGVLTFRMLHWRLESAPAVVGDHLDAVGEHDQCLCMEYVMVLDGWPVGLITNYLRAREAAGMRPEDFRGDFYQLLDSHGVDMADYDIEFTPQCADRRTAELIEVADGDPIQLFEQTIRDSAGAAIDFAIGRMRREARFKVTGIGRVRPAR
ncbi:GntR family transcriptional regulator [Gordonia sp. SL306]|uniref:GntR family transcriptional regulator n=1 Tax=Gordonia sp. SL306 TaxID=2995145 RepID=UPI00226FC74B|nr:GntR family transcriptional regulator [Gordonia sp. SL306]WAC57248.1 GntR family transcriptional regulator [Gordonia sp. SL306]